MITDEYEAGMNEAPKQESKMGLIKFRNPDEEKNIKPIKRRESG